MDLTFKCEKGKVNIRVAAWIQDMTGRHLLVSYYPNGYSSLPGGRVQFGEDSLQALQREMLEEVGQELMHPRLLAIIENFYADDGQDVHEWLYIYQGKVSDEPAAVELVSADQQIGWYALSDIEALRPLCLTQLVEVVQTNHFVHLVNRE